MAIVDEQLNNKQSYKEEICFEKGLPGFPDHFRFVLEQSDLELPFAFLQSLEDTNISFLIGDPFAFFKEYEFDLPHEVESELEIKDINEVMVWVIITLKGSLEESTMNLKAPLVINKNRMLGKQVILNASRYSLREQISMKSTHGGVQDASIKP